MIDEFADPRGGFHWRDGWYFKRLPFGSVRVIKTGANIADNKIEHEIIIPAAEWASIVCSVSAEGETGERWAAAQEFHRLRPAADLEDDDPPDPQTQSRTAP